MHDVQGVELRGKRTQAGETTGGSPVCCQGGAHHSQSFMRACEARLGHAHDGMKDGLGAAHRPPLTVGNLCLTLLARVCLCLPVLDSVCQVWHTTGADQPVACVSQCFKCIECRAPACVHTMPDETCAEKSTEEAHQK